MKRFFRKFREFKVIAISIILASSVAQGIVSSAGDLSSEKSTLETYRLLNLFGDIFARTRSEYIDPVSDQELIEKALNGMLSSLDPHSLYMTEESYRNLKNGMQGVFGGLGIEVTSEHGVVKVISPIDDTPAFRAGLMPGDFIVEVDGQPVLGMTLNETVDKMRGKPGTKVTLKIVREGGKPFSVEVKREFINVNPVRWKIMDGVGYIRVSTFVDTKTGKKVLDALKEIKKKQGNRLKGIILDLRNNAGGLIDQAVEVAGIFLGSKEITSIRGKVNATPKKYFSARKEDFCKGLPLVVLINSGSASCPEIVAGALKDHKRAVIMGVRSFGKGSVQTIFPVQGRGAMVLTTDLYYTPKGHVIQARGVEPHIVVKPAKIELIEYSNFREEDIPRALLSELKSSKGKEKTQDKKTQKLNGKSGKKEALTPFDLRQNEEKDFQIQRAVDLIKGLSVCNEQESIKEDCRVQKAQS